MLYLTSGGPFSTRLAKTVLVHPAPSSSHTFNLSGPVAVLHGWLLRPGRGRFPMISTVPPTFSTWWPTPPTHRNHAPTWWRSSFVGEYLSAFPNTGRRKSFSCTSTECSAGSRWRNSEHFAHELQASHRRKLLVSPPAPPTRMAPLWFTREYGFPAALSLAGHASS